MKLATVPIGGIYFFCQIGRAHHPRIGSHLETPPSCSKLGLGLRGMEGKNSKEHVLLKEYNVNLSCFSNFQKYMCWSKILYNEKRVEMENGSIFLCTLQFDKTPLDKSPVNHSISKQPCCCHGTKPSWRVPGSHPLTADNGKRCLCCLTSANAAGHWWQPSFFWAPQTLFKIFTVSPMAVSSCLDGALSNFSFLSKQHSFPFHTSQQDTSMDHSQWIPTPRHGSSP